MRFYAIEIYRRTTAQEDSLTESLSFSRIMGVSEITSSETVRIHPQSTQSVGQNAVRYATQVASGCHQGRSLSWRHH